MAERQTVQEEHKSGGDTDKRTLDEEYDDEDSSLGEHLDGSHLDEPYNTDEARLAETRKIRQEKQDRVDRAVKEELEVEMKYEHGGQLGDVRTEATAQQNSRHRKAGSQERREKDKP